MHIKDNKLLTSCQVSKLVHNAMLLNQHKNKKFLQKLFDMKLLHFYDCYDPSKKAISEFFKLLDLFEAKYKSSYDLGFTFDGTDFWPYFKVLYPEFTITNSNGNYHTIRDLMVLHKVHYKNNHIYTSEPLGGRLSKTELEIAACYQQSHLSSVSNWNLDPLNYFTSFCVGGDTDVSRMIAEFRVELDWNRYELYLFCIDSMVTWESLEGIPYRKISEIKNALNKEVTDFSTSSVNRVINSILSSKIPLNFNFYIKNNRYHIRPDEKANNLIKEVILDQFTPSEYKNLIVFRQSNTFDRYLQLKTEKSDSDIYKITDNESYTVFNGKKIFPRIIKKDKRNEKLLSLDDHIVYPNFLKNVLTELEYRIYEKAVTKSRIKKLNSSSNARRSFTSDTVSM